MNGRGHLGAGAIAGLTAGHYLGLAPGQVAACAALAMVTSAGWTSPDMDHTPGWRTFAHVLPRPWRGHRRVTHWWGLPVAVAVLVHAVGSPWWAWALLAGWTSHLVADLVFGARSWGRGPGIPMTPSGHHIGVGLDVGEWPERVTADLLRVTAAALGAAWVALPVAQAARGWVA